MWLFDLLENGTVSYKDLKLRYLHYDKNQLLANKIRHSTHPHDLRQKDHKNIFFTTEENFLEILKDDQAQNYIKNSKPKENSFIRISKIQPILHIYDLNSLYEKTDIYKFTKYLEESNLLKGETFIKEYKNLLNIKNTFIDAIIQFDIQEYLEQCSEQNKKPDIDKILELKTIKTLIDDPKKLGPNRLEIKDFYNKMEAFGQNPKLVLQKLIQDCCKIYLQECLFAKQPSTTLESSVGFSKTEVNK